MAKQKPAIKEGSFFSMIPFEQEIELARKAGVTHPENLPFLLQPDNPTGHGILLVHGFSASPREMRALGEALVAQNFTVLGIRLPGHGTTPEDLAQRSLEEWLAAVEHGYSLLAENHLKISAVGLSTGALLLLNLSLQKNFQRLVLLSPFLKLSNKFAPFVGLLSWVIPYQKRDIAIEDQPFYYPRRPLNGVAQINRLLNQLPENLHNFKSPTLVLTTEGDQTIAPGTAKQLFNELGSQQKLFHCYGPQVPHVLTTTENPRQQDVFSRIIDFLSPVQSSQAPQQVKSFTSG